MSGLEIMRSTEPGLALCSNGDTKITSNKESFGVVLRAGGKRVG